MSDEIKSKVRVGSVYEDLTGTPYGPIAGFGRGAKWTVLGVGCDGMFVACTADGARGRLVSKERYKRVHKGTGDVVEGVWESAQAGVLPWVCKHGQAAGEGNAAPRCFDCLTYIKAAELDYKRKARLLWQTCY